MKNTPVRSAMSPIELAVWGATYARVRLDGFTPMGAGVPGEHERLRLAIDGADQAVIDLRDALGTEHSSLAMRELADDPRAALEVLRLRMLAPPDLTPIDPSDCDCLMPWDEFLTACTHNSFIDDDGHGELATATGVSRIRVSPSEVVSPDYQKPEWATHVNWYNK